MERRFNLIKSDFEKHEKRVLPRFPFCYLTFKSDENSRVYEVKDISSTGMQISLKDNSASFSQDSSVRGSIHWLGSHLNVSGVVKWTTQNRLGVEFNKRKELLDQVNSFLKTEEIVKKLKPLHKVEGGLEVPPRLKYWLRADGPVEVFIWQHGDGEISKVQILYLDAFFEWEDGVGAKTGRILSKRNVDSPLLTEDEWVFNLDAYLDAGRLLKIKELINSIGTDLLPKEVQSFLLRQLS